MYTEKEINENELIIRDLICDKISLAEHIKKVLDSKKYRTDDEAIDSVINSKYKHSLAHYCIISENYEMCAYIKDEYAKIIKNNLKNGES